MASERTVAALTADARVRVRSPDIGDIRVALDAGHLTRVSDRPKLVLLERARAKRPETPVVTWYQQPTHSDKHCDAGGEDRGQPQQVLVRSEARYLRLLPAPVSRVSVVVARR